jgi:hypothetical protein
MYITQIDELFYNILNKFNIFLNKEKAFEELLSDTNFVKFQNKILDYIKQFTLSISKKSIIEIIKNESYYDSILNIIKRYCAFYIYLGIGYFYEGGRDLFITNIIEISKYQKENTFQINNFFNSENNAKIITFYSDIKNILGLLNLKTIDKIKLFLINNSSKYESTIKLFNEFGEDYIIEYFLIKDNLHNILNSFIFRLIYLKEEKIEIINVLNQQDKTNAEYKYIDIIVSNEKKIVDFNIIQKFLTISQNKSGLAEEIYNYLEEYRDTQEFIIKESQDYINYLFSNKIIIPITEDFLRYHKDTEKYDTENLSELIHIKDRDATKIKYIMSKMTNVRNYYSQLFDKNPKLKLDTDKLFYKPLDPRMAVLYNNDEEVKIIQKLELSENTSDYDLLIELQNLRKYAYINFKNFSRDGIKIRISKTIQAIRSTSLKQKPKTPIETRIGNDIIDMNIIGIAWNPSKRPLNSFITEDMTDVRKNINNQNGYASFIETMKKTFKNPQPKLFYWLFDNSLDKPEFETYVNYSSTDVGKNIKIMIEEIYKKYIILVTKKLNNYFNKIKDITIWRLNHILDIYTKRYFDLNLIPSVKYDIIKNVIINKIIEYPILIDDIDSLIPGRKAALIELPSVNLKKNKTNIIKLGKQEIEISIDSMAYNIPICYHYIKWIIINKMSKKTDEFNQAVFNFVKQYIKINLYGDYICKSCGEGVPIRKFVFEGTYIAETDTFLTTSMAVYQQLDEIPKYTKYMKTIRNIEKNIEKFAYSIDLVSFLGNDSAIKSKRKVIIKDIIDLVLIHTEWLRKQPTNRIETASRNFGINKEFTNLFFFDITDDIFSTSSTDTDYYKIIKYNNIIAYLFFFILIEMNSGHIVNLKEDKQYNYFFFEKVKDILFDKLYLRINQKEKIGITKLPLFAYVLYYLSGICVSKKIWLYNDNNLNPKEKMINIIKIQKIVIHTVIDLINTLVEANFDENKNFLYEILNTRINIKLNHIYKDELLLKRVKTISMKNIQYDETTQKVIFTTKKLAFINLDIPFNITKNIKESCISTIISSSFLADQKGSPKTQLDTFINKNNIDFLTNCPDGKFHNWIFKNNDLICSLCNSSYNNSIKTLTTTTTEDNTVDYLNKIKNINLNKLFQKYCISGDIHNLNDAKICSKCKKNVNTYILSNKELKELEKNIETRTNETILLQINEMKKLNDENKKEHKTTKDKINKLLSKYDSLEIINKTSKFEYCINQFINKLMNILGNKIKINNQTIYLNDTVYIIDHNYYGSPLKDKLYILSSQNKINIIHKHPYFKIDVLYYKDNTHNMYVYYNSITLQYLGYSNDNKTIKKVSSDASLQIELSIKDYILFLGYENQQFNIFHINKEYQINQTIVSKDILLHILRDRIHNLKQIIIRIQSIIFNINKGGTNISAYNTEEKEIINEFTKKLTHFNLNGKTKPNNIFKYSSLIINNLSLNYNIPKNISFELNKNYLDVKLLNSLENTDCKLIFYMIHNLTKLLDYNTQTHDIQSKTFKVNPISKGGSNTTVISSGITSELAYLIVKLLTYSFHLYYKSYANYNIRKFDYLLLNDNPSIDETLKTVGHYQELLSQQDIDDTTKKEENENAREELDAIDIDDYEQTDDIDEFAEINETNNTD